MSEMWYFMTWKTWDIWCPKPNFVGHQDRAL